jgi:hypothetical protein
MQSSIAILVCSVLLAAVLTGTQEPAPSTTGQQGTVPEKTGTPQSSSNGKTSKLPPYVITGTIFNESTLSYPNVRVRIRRVNEKKFRWDTYTNSRGEFAVRVPEGQKYEVFVHQKSYKDVSVKVTADNSAMEQKLSIRLEKVNAEKDSSKK